MPHLSLTPEHLDGLSPLLHDHHTLIAQHAMQGEVTRASKLDRLFSQITAMNKLQAMHREGHYTWTAADDGRLALLQAEFERTRGDEHHNVPDMVEGFWRDIRTDRDGKLLDVSPWHHNLVVNAFAVLVSTWMVGNGAGGVGTSAPVQYMAVGTGQVSWDTSRPPPTLTDVALNTELARKAVTATYAVGNAVSATPTNSCLVTCTFNIGEANGTLREWGLFGGNATGTAGSGYMIDHVTTTALPKTAGVDDFSLTRIVAVTF